jgi:CHAD domain-containing protein
VHNRLQEGYISVNSCSPPPLGQHQASLQPEGPRYFDKWRDLLAQCALKPTRGRVHALRSLTLRLQTLLEFQLQQQPTDPEAARAFKRWSKEGKKLRRALEPMRNADVYLARLSSLTKSHAGSTGGKPDCTGRCRREMAKLTGRLKRKRRKGAGRLKVDMEARCKRMNRLGKKMEAAFAPHMYPAADSLAPRAMSIFSELAREVPALDSASLHDWRKRLKQALYLAELSAPSAPAAKRLAVALRKMHSAAGAWHDWQALALEAARVLPGKNKPDGLIAVLNRQAQAALDRALDLCRRTAGRFIGNAGEAPVFPPRKPVNGVNPQAALDGESRSA